MPASKAAAALLFWLVQSCYGQSCPDVSQVTFNLISDGCRLPACDAYCMSNYTYSQRGSISGTTSCDVQIVPVMTSILNCQCFGASGTTQEITFDGGEIRDVVLSWNGVPGESELTATVTPYGTTCQLVYDPPPAPANCPNVDQVTFNLISNDCQLSEYCSDCMSGYTYSQLNDGTTCNVRLDPVENSFGICQCFGASGTTQKITFDGGEIQNVMLSWNGVPGESELTAVAVTPDGTCQLVYDPQSKKTPLQQLPWWAIILIAFVGLLCIGGFALLAYRFVKKSRRRDEMAIAMNEDNDTL